MAFDLHECAVTVRDAAFSYGAQPALSQVDFELEAGRVLAVIGANGAGKSTLFRAIAGLVPLDHGEIHVFGCNADALSLEHRSRIAYVSEAHAELGEATVAELAAFRQAMYRSFDRSALEALLDRSRIAWRAQFGALSRGQRALVAVGLALAQQPDLLLLDEPTLGLDPLARRTVIQAVLAAARSSACTVVLATHEVADVERVADDLLFLSRGRVAISLVEQCEFVARSSSVRAPRTDRVERALEQIDEVIFAWPRREQLEIVLAGDDDARDAACERIAAIAGEAVSQRPISLEDATLAWLARDNARMVSRD